MSGDVNLAETTLAVVSENSNGDNTLILTDPLQHSRWRSIQYVTIEGITRDSDPFDPRNDITSTILDERAEIIHLSRVMTALLNYALLHQCILKEYNRAENIYRRALALNPNDSRIVSNFNWFEDQRYPEGYYVDSRVPFTVVERSHIVEESLK